MKMLLCLVLLSLSQLGFTQTVEFERGNTMTTDEISGFVYVSCRNQFETKEFGYSCYDLALNGGSYGRISVSGDAIDADWVKLQRSGTKYIKGSKFNAETQSTGKNFNLWIRTLLQRALLKRGVNEINYTFSKNQVDVHSGTMTVNVEEGDSRMCATRTLWYTSSCPSISQACSDYFYRQNYCR